MWQTEFKAGETIICKNHGFLEGLVTMRKAYVVCEPLFEWEDSDDPEVRRWQDNTAYVWIVNDRDELTAYNLDMVFYHKGHPAYNES